MVDRDWINWTALDVAAGLLKLAAFALVVATVARTATNVYEHRQAVERQCRADIAKERAGAQLQMDSAVCTSREHSGDEACRRALTILEEDAWHRQDRCVNAHMKDHSLLDKDTVIALTTFTWKTVAFQCALGLLLLYLFARTGSDALASLALYRRASSVGLPVVLPTKKDL